MDVENEEDAAGKLKLLFNASAEEKVEPTRRIIGEKSLERSHSDIKAFSSS